MDSRRVSAALGFALLIGCVIGIVILIHNSGTSRRSSSTPLSSGAAGDRHHHHSFVSSNKENSFVNDPNYRSSQPTMQEMNELADGHHRLLSPKSKHVVGSFVNGTMNKPLFKKKDNSSLLQLDRHHKAPSHPSATSSSASGKKASITAVNYSNIPSSNQPRPHSIQKVANPHLPYAHQNLQTSEHLPVGPTAGGQMTVVDFREPGGLGRERGGLPNDFYKTPWLPSISGGVLSHSQPSHLNNNTKSNQQQHHHHPYPPSKQSWQQGHHQRPPLPNANSVPNPPYLPPFGIDGRPHAPLNRFGHPSKPVTIGSMDTVEDTYDDLSEEEETDDPEKTAGHKKLPASNGDIDTGDDEEWEEVEEEDDDQDPKNKAGDLEPKDFIADFQTLFDLANHLYTTPGNNKSGSVFQGLLKVINETIERGNNSRLLAELNEMYEGRLRGDGNITNSSMTSEGATELLKEEQKKTVMTPNETSFAAFAFMSFGVFLLYQIHSFLQKSSLSPGAPGGNKGNGTEDASPAVGRALLGQDFFDWYVEPMSLAENGEHSVFFAREPSSLDILFEEPEESRSTKTKTETPSLPKPSEWKGRSVNDNNDNSFSSSQHVNNMFRAFLNIVNAYTKNSQAMECIWSLYCQDLDYTAGKRGLYGVASRINSVGLRLIMNQIPPALTMDVILRSLVGWDGLPCHKMFLACAANNGTISLADNNAAKIKRQNNKESRQ